MAAIGVEYWNCKRCRHQVMTRDQSGKPFKKIPYSCPSCGHRCDKDCKHDYVKLGASSPDPKR